MTPATASVFLPVLLAAFSLWSRLSGAETERKPVPDKLLRDEARRFLGPVVEIKPQSRSEAQKGAQQLLEKAQDVKADSIPGPGTAAVQYVLLDKARELSELGVNAELVVQAIDRLGELFDVDVLKSKHESLKKILQGIQDKRETVDFAYLCLDLSDDRIAADDYDRAKDFANLAMLAAKGSQKKGLDLIAARELRDVAALSSGFKRLGGAFSKLKENPGDLKANSEVGEFYCYLKESWKQGMPYLAKGDNLRRVDIVKLELEASADAWKNIQLAEKWIQLAKDEDKRNQAPLFRHALDLLRLAAQNGDALARVRVDALEKEIPIEGDLKLRIKVMIDGSDELRISDFDMTWVHRQYDWPSKLRVNDHDWQPKTSSSCPHPRTFGPVPRTFDGTRFDFAAATLVKKEGRGELNHRVKDRALVVQFGDNPNGAAAYEAEIVIPRKGR